MDIKKSKILQYALPKNTNNYSMFCNISHYQAVWPVWSYGQKKEGIDLLCND